MGVTVVMVLVFSLSAYFIPASAGTTFAASLRGAITTLIPPNATITASSNLNKADVECLVQETKSSASEDARHQETIQASSEADQAIYLSEKLLRNLGKRYLCQTERRSK
ncbi:MAG TPA: hypothetical protein VLM80_02785 [Anaerolineales bacterium]|nr:hypothetical protein [Anaerolineales bacterium]